MPRGYRTGLPVGLLSEVSKSEIIKGNEIHTDLGEKTGKGHSLSTHLKGDDLNRVKGLHGRPAKRVADLEDINPSKHGFADRRGDGILLRLGIEVRDVGHGGRHNDPDPAEAADDVDDDQHGAPADFVYDGCPGGGEDDLDCTHAELDVDLGDFAVDTGGVEECTQVVRYDTWICQHAG